VGTLLSAVDALKLLVSGRLAGESPEPPREVLESLAALLGAGPPAPAAGPAARAEPDPGDEQLHRYHITLRLVPEIFATGTDPLQLLLELEELGELERVVCHTEELPPVERLEPDLLYLWWEVWLLSPESAGTIDNVFIFVQEENQIQVEQLPPGAEPAPAPAAEPRPQAQPRPQARDQASPARRQPAPRPAEQAPAGSAPPLASPGQAAPARPAHHSVTPPPTIRVDTDKLDKLVNLVGELVIGVARVNQLSSADGEAGELGSAVEALDHISRDLQEQVMRVRMIPIEGTFNRFQRVVRDLASELGKKIHLEVTGAETELDKNVIEQIADPLKHLIRNSADHGLEPPDERAAAGKSETGTIWLKAYQQEGKIIIEVADDGRGIDRDRVLAKAVERGLAPAGGGYSDQEAFAFMFQPGFSTAEAVTEVSGRGVGLDVVRQNIEALRGSVEVESVPGRGSTFRIKLPLTLAIIDGMTVKVGGEVLTLPLLSILESLRPQDGEIQKVEGRGELITVRGEYLPLVRLYEVFSFPTERTDPTQALVVIIESVSKRFGVLVDDILGEQQAVIKSLEQNYQKVEGVAGATILGDGRVSLILDIHGLEKLAFG
jgi:two-component system chemotaxis sensor kinase CheA